MSIKNSTSLNNSINQWYVTSQISPPAFPAQQQQASSPEEYMGSFQTPMLKEPIEKPREPSLGVKNLTFDFSKTDLEKLSGLSTEFGAKADAFSQEKSVENLNNSQELSETMFIKIKEEDISRLKGLNPVIKNKLVSYIQEVNTFFSKKMPKIISIKKAYQINKIASQKIFVLEELREADVDKFPLHPRQIERMKALEEAMKKKGKKTSGIDHIDCILSGNQMTISYGRAQDLDRYFGTKMFDFRSIFSYAIQIAEREMKQKGIKEFPVPSSFSETSKEAQNKRKRSEVSTGAAAGSVVPSLKRQCTQRKTNLTLLNGKGHPTLQPPSNIEHSTLNASNSDSNTQGANKALLPCSFHAQRPPSQPFFSSPYSSYSTSTSREPNLLSEPNSESNYVYEQPSSSQFNIPTPEYEFHAQWPSSQPFVSPTYSSRSTSTSRELNLLTETNPESNIEEAIQTENAPATLFFSQQTDDVIDIYLEDARNDHLSKYENWDEV